MSYKEEEFYKLYGRHMTKREKFADFLAEPAHIWMFFVNLITHVPFSIIMNHDKKIMPSARNIIAIFKDMGAKIILRTDEKFTPPSTETWITMMQLFAHDMVEKDKNNLDKK